MGRLNRVNITFAWMCLVLNLYKLHILFMVSCKVLHKRYVCLFCVANLIPDKKSEKLLFYPFIVTNFDSNCILHLMRMFLSSPNYNILGAWLSFWNIVSAIKFSINIIISLCSKATSLAIQQAKQPQTWVSPLCLRRPIYHFMKENVIEQNAIKRSAPLGFLRWSAIQILTDL